MAYSHDIVAHNWAHQTGKKCRGFNMFYEGETIYSYGYHFPIARFFTAPNGERIVVFSEERRSVSTSKHQITVRRALGYPREDLLEVPFLNGTSAYDAERWVEYLDKAIETSTGKWQRARVYKDSHAGDIIRAIHKINAILQLWQLDHIPQREVPEDIAAFAASHEERRKAERIEEDKADREKIKKWLNGEDVVPPHTRIPYVRVMPSPRVAEYEVQTSWGVKVPLADAMKLYRMAGLVRIVGKIWRPSKRHQIGGWTVDHIAADGTLKAGCHVIPFKVQQEAARLAGLDATTFHINQANQMEAA
jgi:hypothetical protein